MLYNLCIYQVISCSVGLIMFLLALVNGRFANAGILTYLFHRAVRKAESDENFELDLFKTPSPPRHAHKK